MTEEGEQSSPFFSPLCDRNQLIVAVGRRVETRFVGRYRLSVDLESGVSICFFGRCGGVSRKIEKSFGGEFDGSHVFRVVAS